MQVVIGRMLLAGQLISITALPAPANAQSNVTAALTAAAHVVTPFALRVTHALDFGPILTSTSKTHAPNSSSAGTEQITAVYTDQ